MDLIKPNPLYFRKLILIWIKKIKNTIKPNQLFFINLFFSKIKPNLHVTL